LFTTALLVSVTSGLLPAWPGTWNKSGLSCTAFRNLSPSEASLTLTEMRYRFRFPHPPKGYYKIVWVERFSPEGGGAAVDTAREWEWDGIVPEGHDALDSATWPVSPVYEVPAPVEVGTVSIQEVEVLCRPES
jgi:hypothetical protein